MAKKNGVNPFVGIATRVGGSYLLVSIVFLLISPRDELLIPIAWAFVALGAVLSFFAYKAEKK